MRSDSVGRTPPYRIETERLVIRCWEPQDAPLLKEAIDSSLDHLRPWMPWAREEPQSLAQKVELLRHFRGRFDLGKEFVFGVFSADEGEVVGGTGLHRRVRGEAFEIGYWIRASRVGDGLATEAVAALTRVAFELCDVDRLEIHVEPANEASRAIPRKLGYTEEATLRRRLPSPSAEAARRDEVIFTLFAEEFATSPLASAPATAYDGTGAKVL